MKNYERYSNVTSRQYDKKSVMYYLCGVPSYRKIYPLISNLKGKNILEVGLGTGFYTKILLKNNMVIGVDVNPHLCQLPIRLYKGSATELSRLVGDERFDLVFSILMTEYLADDELQAFFVESRKVLNKDGRLITTVISSHGMGFAYIFLAKTLKGISKYCYKRKAIIEKLTAAGFDRIEILRLNSWLGVPWAYLAIAQYSQP
ncbi:MAG: class I SAM-dependent methyltransferase [Planctomycetota bacterium]